MPYGRGQPRLYLMLSLGLERVLPLGNVFNLLRNYSEELLMVDLELLAGEVRQSLAESFTPSCQS
jgi:hypothetical protein